MSRYIAVLKAADLLPGKSACVHVESEAIAIFNIRGQLYATSNTCTHADAALSEGLIEGDEVECPLHGARFNIKTGKVLCAPAYEDLKTYPVKISGEMIEIAIED